MATSIQNTPAKSALSPRALVWLVSFSILAALLVLLTKAIMDDPALPLDIETMDWIVGWDFWGVNNVLGAVSAVTEAKAGLIYVVLGIGFLLLLGKTRPAIVFTTVGVTIGAVAILGDLTLGELVDRGRPLAFAANPSPAFPSGHVFASTVFFGFIGFLAVYYRMKPKLLLPMLAVLGVIILLVGPSRVHVQAHFPSDAAAGYLLALLWLMVIIPVFLIVRSTRWMSAWQNKENAEVVACDDCNVASSIASVVVLDPVEGTATKVYTPPPLVRLLYWMAFQAKFPYENNRAALDTATYRRKIASALTVHRFGKDLVAGVTAVECEYQACSFVTESHVILELR